MSKQDDKAIDAVREIVSGLTRREREQIEQELEADDEEIDCDPRDTRKR